MLVFFLLLEPLYPGLGSLAALRTLVNLRRVAYKWKRQSYHMMEGVPLLSGFCNKHEEITILDVSMLFRFVVLSVEGRGDGKALMYVIKSRASTLYHTKIPDLLRRRKIRMHEGELAQGWV